MRARLNPAPPPEMLQKPVVGVLLPLPLAGAYDYKLPPGVNAGRGAVVSAPLGNREVLGVVWGAAEGTVGDNRLKLAEPLEGAPAPAGQIVRLHRLGGGLHLEPAGRDPGHGAALARRLRAGSAAHRLCARRVTPPRLSAGRARALEVAGDGLARSVTGLAEDANVSPAVVRGLIQAGALIATELPEFAPSAQPDAGFRRAAAERRSGAAARVARGGGGAKIFRPSAGWRHRIGQDRSLFRSGGGSARTRQAGDDPAAGDRADGAVPGTLRGALRGAARRNGTATCRRRNAAAPIAP